MCKVHSSDYLEPDDTKKGQPSKVLTEAEKQNLETLFELGLAYLKPGERHQARLGLDDDGEGEGDEEESREAAGAGATA